MEPLTILKKMIDIKSDQRVCLGTNKKPVPLRFKIFGRNVQFQKKPGFWILLLFVTAVWTAGYQTTRAQTPISDITATYDNINDTSDDYTAGSTDYNFNVGTENNLNLESCFLSLNNTPHLPPEKPATCF